MSRDWLTRRYRYVTGGTHRSAETRALFERNNARNMEFYRAHYRAHFPLIAQRVREANTRYLVPRPLESIFPPGEYIVF
jgi:hypothetical protein